jgi:ferredoxin
VTRRFHIDVDLCQCTGQCVHLAPAHFELRGDGTAQVRADAPSPDATLAEVVVGACPSMAIEVVGE